MSVLEERYASDAMKTIWSKESKIKLERKLWIAVMKSQAKAGLSIPPKAISEYEKVIEVIDFESIREREEVLHHDVKARIEEFNQLAGHQFIHLGMTSRDLTENVELYQIKKSLQLTADKSASLLYIISQLSNKYADIPMVARTHNVPAQVTTLGRRLATWGEELLFSLKHLQDLIERLPLRGLKGAIGTSSDFEQLIPNNSHRVETELKSQLGFDHHLSSTSQIYPRSIDLEVVSTLNQIAATPSNLALNIRLMSGNNLVSEGFEEGQTGSSAMPHKVNPRLSERVNSLAIVLKGFLVMVNEVSGNQWNEGDVSCSAVRRIALPGSFFAIDGIIDSAIHILHSLKINEQVIKAELDENLPLLLSSTLLMQAVSNGVGREFAHRRIKECAMLGIADQLKGLKNTFLERVLADPELRLDANSIKSIFDSPFRMTGLSKNQIEKFTEEVELVLREYSSVKAYKPVKII